MTDYIQYHVYLVSNIKMIIVDSKQQNPQKKAVLDTADETATGGSKLEAKGKTKSFLKKYVNENQANFHLIIT